MRKAACELRRITLLRGSVIADRSKVLPMARPTSAPTLSMPKGGCAEPQDGYHGDHEADERPPGGTLLLAGGHGDAPLPQQHRPQQDGRRRCRGPNPAGTARSRSQRRTRTRTAGSAPSRTPAGRTRPTSRWLPCDSRLRSRCPLRSQCTAIANFLEPLEAKFRELPFQRLSGKSEQTPFWGPKSLQKGVKGTPSTLRATEITLQPIRPAIFQTVSPRTRMNKAS
jgi:hypothetical protein